MKIFVLSLKNETGEKRRSKLNYPHDVMWGTSNLVDVPEEFKIKVNMFNLLLSKNFFISSLIFLYFII